MTLKKIITLLLLILLSLGLYYFYLQFKLKSQETAPIPVATEKIVSEASPSSEMKIINEVTDYRLPSGKQTYSVTHGDSVVGPRMDKITYDPLLITIGEPQTITVSFPVGEIISSAVIFIDTDNLKKQKLTLKKTDNPLNIWSGTWTPTDTNLKHYTVRFYFVGPTGTYDVSSYFL